MNNIIKLTNGETIIAEIIHQDEETISILEPLALEVGEGESGRPMMIALTWIPLTKKVNMVNLNPNHVVAIAELDDEMNLYYEKSLAVLKNDSERLREILKEETGIENLEEIEERLLESQEHEHDPWMEKFGTPLEIEPSANTVH